MTSSRVFSGLSDAERARVLASAWPRVLKPRDVLAEQGTPATTFYVVQVGHLKLSKLSPDGREIIVRFAGPGDPFAGIVALGQPTYPVSATAVESTRVLGWTREALVPLAEALPRLRANILDEITSHLTDALDRVQELTTERVSQRLARTLLRLVEHGGHRVEGGIAIAHPITRQELADLTGTTLFSVSRLLSRWEGQGLVASTRGRITIKQEKSLLALTERADED